MDMDFSVSKNRFLVTVVILVLPLPLYFTIITAIPHFRHLAGYMNSSEWEEVPAALQKLEQDGFESLSSYGNESYYSFITSYTYRYNTRNYTGSRFNVSPLFSEDPDIPEKVRVLKAKGQFTCWVNPANPSESSLVRMISRDLDSRIRKSLTIIVSLLTTELALILLLWWDIKTNRRFGSGIILYPRRLSGLAPLAILPVGTGFLLTITNFDSGVLFGAFGPYRGSLFTIGLMLLAILVAAVISLRSWLHSNVSIRFVNIKDRRKPLEIQLQLGMYNRYTLLKDKESGQINHMLVKGKIELLIKEDPEEDYYMDIATFHFRPTILPTPQFPSTADLRFDAGQTEFTFPEASKQDVSPIIYPEDDPEYAPPANEKDDETDDENKSWAEIFVEIYREELQAAGMMAVALSGQSNAPDAARIISDFVKEGTSIETGFYMITEKRTVWIPVPDQFWVQLV